MVKYGTHVLRTIHTIKVSYSIYKLPASLFSFAHVFTGCDRSFPVLCDRLIYNCCEIYYVTL